MKSITTRIFNVRNDLESIQVEITNFKSILTKEDEAVVDINKICSSQTNDLLNLSHSIKDSVVLIDHINELIEKSRIFVQEKRSS